MQTDNTVIKASDNPYLEPVRNLQYRRGYYLQYGDDVKWAQWHLWRFGLFVGKNRIPDASMIDGYWGEKSEAALKEAQRRLGLPDTGILTQTTRDVFKTV